MNETVIAAVLGLIFVIALAVFYFGGLEQTSNQIREIIGLVTGQVGTVTGGSTCKDLMKKCNNWVVGSIGHHKAYLSSGMDQLNDCTQIRDYCPQDRGFSSRIQAQDCLEICIDQIDCIKNYAQKGYDNVAECSLEELDETLEELS